MHLWAVVVALGVLGGATGAWQSNATTTAHKCILDVFCL